MQSSTSPDLEPMLVVVISGDQTKSKPYVYHTLDLAPEEIARLLESSRSSPGGSHSRSCTGKIYSSLPPLSNTQRKARMWHEALQRKRSAAKMMLAAQQVIEEVEEEVGQSVSSDTLNRLRSEFYDVDDIGGDPTAESYIATISAVRMEFGESESTLGDSDSSANKVNS